MPAQNLPGMVLDRAHPLSRGLVGWWPMNEGAGTRINDISGKGNHGTISGVSQSSTSGWTGGPVGGALRFDATDDLVTVPHSSSLNVAAEFSVSCWVSINTTANYPTFVMKGNGGAGYAGPFHFLYESIGGYWLFATGNGLNAQNAVAYGTAATLGRIYHIVGVHTGGAGTGATDLFYQDGKLVRSGTTGIPVVNNGTALGIGGRTPGTLYGLNDRIYGVRMWDRALSAVEVAQLYADPLAGARAPVSAARYFVPATISPPAAPPTADRLWNRGYVGRIFRRGEKG
jgi:hypothetical protein